MNVEMQHIQKGLADYIESEIAAKAEGVRKFAVYFAAPQIVKDLTGKLDDFKKNPMFSEFFTAEGVNLDLAYDQAKSAMQKAGHVELYGISFGASDIDALNSAIRRAAGG